MISLYSDLQGKLEELSSKVMPLASLIKDMRASFAAHADRSDDREVELVKYLELKQQLLLSYCTNILFYLLLKVEGQSVKSHPVMKQLLELRYAMEKMKPLDNKLKPQLDRLMKATAGGTASLKPNLASMLNNVPTKASKAGGARKDASEEEEDQGDGSEGEEDPHAGVYRPPKMSAAIFRENENAAQKAEKKMAKQRKKLRNNEILESLREEFSEAPEAVSSTGVLGKTSEEKRIEEEMEERRVFEEDRFTRLALTRKDKQAIKRREREAMKGGMNTDDLMVDIGDIGDIEHMVSAKKGGVDYVGLGDSVRRSKSSKHQSQEEDSFAGQDHKSAAVSAKSLKYASRVLANTGDSEEEDSHPARRRAPDARDLGGEEEEYDFDYMNQEGGAGGEEDDEESLLESFAQRKRAHVEEKAALHNVNKQPRYGGFDNSVEDGEKRKASYQILKNRGLTPHRKTANKNPRVKKREDYRKAVIAKKGQVREVVVPTSSYGGELTGIKANISHSRRL